ncbi:S-adenosyl-L-methionine-dependent methyltransferase [Syncephalis fuscata]|nr:S-adenosyl-L-methionine-dependent methyltransferase [Syncephalis fuscata]
MEYLQNTTSSQEQAEAASCVYEEGRRFHGEQNAPYPMPNDSSEVDRLNAQHHVIKRLLNGNYMSKLNNPRRILDVGSGTGIWAKEMAEEFPQCEINCIDISPELSMNNLPSNVKFETMNALEGIKYEANKFSYVHVRLLCIAIPEDYWSLYMKDLTRICSSGGSVELFETNGELMNAGPLGQEVNFWFDTMSRRRGVNLNKAWQIPQMMQEAGLQMETEHYIKIPIGEWCDKVGHQGWTDYYNLIHSLTARITATCDVTKERLDYVLENLHEENITNRVYRKMGIFVGRKP